MKITYEDNTIVEASADEFVILFKSFKEIEMNIDVQNVKVSKKKLRKVSKKNKVCKICQKTFYGRNNRYCSRKCCVIGKIKIRKTYELSHPNRSKGRNKNKS